MSYISRFRVFWSRAGRQRERQAAGEREENKRRSLVGHFQTNPDPSLSGRGGSGARKGKWELLSLSFFYFAIVDQILMRSVWARNAFPINEFSTSDFILAVLIYSICCSLKGSQTHHQPHENLTHGNKQHSDTLSETPQTLSLHTPTNTSKNPAIESQVLMPVKPVLYSTFREVYIDTNISWIWIFLNMFLSTDIFVKFSCRKSYFQSFIFNMNIYQLLKGGRQKKLLFTFSQKLRPPPSPFFDHLSFF